MNEEQLKLFWKMEYYNFFDELEKFILEWANKLKKCKCDNPECKHYQIEKTNRFGNRINTLFNTSLLMKRKSFIEIQHKVH